MAGLLLTAYSKMWDNWNGLKMESLSKKEELKDLRNVQPIHVAKNENSKGMAHHHFDKEIRISVHQRFNQPFQEENWCLNRKGRKLEGC